MDTDLKRLQGRWAIVSLEVEGTAAPEGAFRESRIVVDGKTFTTLSMGAIYGGTLSVDAGKKPKTLDMKFESGPEKGNTSLAIYELDGDTWTLCLTLRGKTRPKTFATKPGSGLALEVLKRQTEPDARERLQSELALLQGEWSLVSAVRDGEAMPPRVVKTGKRVVAGNETTIRFGGHVYLKAAFTLDPGKHPKTIDYIVTAGEGAGSAQAGIYELDGDTVTYHLAAPGRHRPTDFEITPAAGVVTVWKRARRGKAPAKKTGKAPAKKRGKKAPR